MGITQGPWTAYDDDGTGTLPCVISDQLTAFGNNYVAQCNNYPDARAIAELPGLIIAAKGAIAALSQPKTYQVDIDLAKSFLRDALAAIEGGN